MCQAAWCPLHGLQHFHAFSTFSFFKKKTYLNTEGTRIVFLLKHTKKSCTQWEKHTAHLSCHHSMINPRILLEKKLTVFLEIFSWPFHLSQIYALQWNKKHLSIFYDPQPNQHSSSFLKPFNLSFFMLSASTFKCDYGVKKIKGVLVSPSL